VDCCVGPSNDRRADNDCCADNNNYDRRANNNYDSCDNHDHDYDDNNHYHYYDNSGSRSNCANCYFGSQRRQF
jgi:hypothetical protein